MNLPLAWNLRGPNGSTITFAGPGARTDAELVGRILLTLDRLAEELQAEHVQAAPPADAAETIHRCPPDGQEVMPCCGRTPFEVPRSHRMTAAPLLVTCPTVEDGHDRTGR